jgi:DNA-binding GntR family transcriptional regulator
MHQALASEILDAIGDGTLAVGDRLPPEAELAAQHGVARETVRKSLHHLEQLGMIDRRPRSGTTVIASRPVDGYQPVAQTGADILALAEGTRLLAPEAGEQRLDATTARRIGARPRSTWHVLRGARVVRGTKRPICFSEHFLRGDLEPGPMYHGALPGPDYTAQYRVEQTISADLLSEEIATALGAEAGGPALVVSRRAFDPRGRLANVGIHTHPADRYSVTTIVQPTTHESTRPRG